MTKQAADNTCHSLVVHEGEMANTRQHQVLDHLGAQSGRIQDAHVALLQRQLSALCQPDSTLL